MLDGRNSTPGRSAPGAHPVLVRSPRDEGQPPDASPCADDPGRISFLRRQVHFCGAVTSVRYLTRSRCRIRCRLRLVNVHRSLMPNKILCMSPKGISIGSLKPEHRVQVVLALTGGRLVSMLIDILEVIFAVGWSGLQYCRRSSSAQAVQQSAAPADGIRQAPGNTEKLPTVYLSASIVGI